MMNKDLFGNEIVSTTPDARTPKGRKAKPKTNPLIPVYGVGPEGKKCISCIHQYFKVFQSKYSKCELHFHPRGYTGASTDHNSRYQACGKFEEKTEESITHKHYK